jgi:hypothetical protein
MKSAKWIKCNGEAHSNPAGHDHCGVCMPYWGEYPVCPDCGRKLMAGGATKSMCRTCKKYVDMTRPKAKTLADTMSEAAALKQAKELKPKPDTRPIVESKLSHGDKVELHCAIRDLQMACARIGMALESNNKFTEFETLKEAYMAVKRVEPTITNIMFNFVRGSK